MKKIVLLLITLCTCAGALGATKIKTTQDSLSYALGYIVGGQQLSNYLVGKYGCNKELFLKAVQDALYNESGTMTQAEATDYMHKAEERYQAQQNSKKDVAYKSAKLQNDVYLTGIRTNKQYKEIPNSWDSTQCGVFRKIIKAGTGEKPTVSSAVKFYYSYRLTNGKVVSQSKPGEAIEGLVGNLLPGLQDAFVQMPVGSKWEVVIPSELAFDREEQLNADGSVLVPANSILIFDVELLNTGVPEEIDYYGGER